MGSFSAVAPGLRDNRSTLIVALCLTVLSLGRCSAPHNYTPIGNDSRNVWPIVKQQAETTIFSFKQVYLLNFQVLTRSQKVKEIKDRSFKSVTQVRSLPRLWLAKSRICKGIPFRRTRLCARVDVKNEVKATCPTEETGLATCAMFFSGFKKQATSSTYPGKSQAVRKTIEKQKPKQKEVKKP